MSLKDKTVEINYKKMSNYCNYNINNRNITMYDQHSNKLQNVIARSFM